MRSQCWLSRIKWIKITFFFVKEIFDHAAKGVRGLPKVFNAEARPWISPNHSKAEKVAKL